MRAKGVTKAPTMFGREANMPRRLIVWHWLIRHSIPAVSFATASALGNGSRGKIPSRWAFSLPQHAWGAHLLMNIIVNGDDGVSGLLLNRVGWRTSNRTLCWRKSKTRAPHASATALSLIELVPECVHSPADSVQARHLLLHSLQLLLHVCFSTRS